MREDRKMMMRISRRLCRVMSIRKRRGKEKVPPDRERSCVSEIVKRKKRKVPKKM